MAREMLVNFRVSETPNLRGDRGRFTSEGVQELMNRNRVLAETLRAQVGRRIENRVAFGKRAAASSGRLLAVSVSGKNQQVGRWHVGVGDIDYLDRSTAKYWRTFEEGSAAVWRRPFIGTQLVVVPGRAAELGPGAPSPHGTNLRTARGGIGFKNTRKSDLFVVKREIAPSHIYRDVFNEAHLDEYGLQVARRFLDRIFSTPIKTFAPKI